MSETHRIAGRGPTAPLTFTFDGKPYTGRVGDTLTAALLANGVRIVGRSFKYHRPRGVWGAWVDDPNAIFDVTLNGHVYPNVHGATTLLEDGMALRSVNAWPSAARDVKGGLDLFHRWLGAGFYYKTFIWPDWHLFEPMIRKMAGLGAVKGPEPPGYVSERTYDTCDVLVVGGGPAGLVAARAAAEAGRKVLLVEDRPALGGSAPVCGKGLGDAAIWTEAQAAAIGAAGGRILTGTTAFGIYDHKTVALIERRGLAHGPKLHRLRADQVILATGALDRPLTFPGNDLPGIMSLQAAADYAARFGVRVGNEITVAAEHPMADAPLDALANAGATVRRLPKGAPLKGIGWRDLRAVRAGEKTHAADILAVSAGWTPLVHLWRHAGGKLTWSDALSAFIPGAGPAWLTAVGAAAGRYDLSDALTDAEAAARGAARPEPLHYTVPAPTLDASRKGRQWIDFQHDVTLKDITLAAQENYASVEHLKRYTTLGMAVDQGKTSNMPGLTALAAAQGKPVPDVGTTTFRPPYTPVPLELYSGPVHRGQGLHPPKRLPLEREHRAAGAALSEYGGWLRPAWYGTGNRDATIQAEAKAARDSVGIFDASPLGKIEVMGPDAAQFLNFVYYNRIDTLKPGAIRYGFMLTEAGIVYDDGVVARLGPDHFLVSCSSSHADGVTRHLEAWRQDGNDPNRIFIHDRTQDWVTLAVTGPTARRVLERLHLDIDLSPDAFPHMQMRHGRFAEGPLRLARVSFTGDLSFEISVPALNGASLWSSLERAGAAEDARLIGIEALSILRAEKGFIMVGKDTDGETMPHDLGFGAPRLRKPRPFVGDRALDTPFASNPNRKALVGLVVDGDAPLATGAHIVTGGAAPRSIGVVTSSYLSPNTGSPIALASLERGALRHGEEVTVWHLGETRTARVSPPCHFDPDGERLHAK